ncbi:MAG: Era-like GTP-binding protein [Candidatus Thorarchaeota archaeon]
MDILSIIRKKRTKKIVLGIIGEVNAGKTTLANRIGRDFAGKEVGVASPIPHETREVCALENCLFQANGGTVDLTLLDTPGITSTVNYESFLSHGLSRKEAIQRAKEATKGVVEAIKALDSLDAAVLVVDAIQQPFNQVNWTILGNLAARNIPVIVAANKQDLKGAEIGLELIKDAFEENPVIPISALKGNNMDALYGEIANSAA